MIPSLLRLPTPRRRIMVVVFMLLLAAGKSVAQPTSDDNIPPAEVPIITQLKDLNRTTALVENGEAQIVIAAPSSGAYDAEAERVQAAIRRVTGVTVPVVGESAPEASLPLQSNLIALGNRSTNPVISTLYNRYYTLLDLKYPGPGGHVVRSLHTPFGNGYNVLFAGGSDDAGVEAASRVLVRELENAGGRQGALSVGWLMDIELSDQYDVPDDPEDVKLWVESRGYGNRGTFGWSMITKRMALYYMTGKAKYARDFLRLAYPDEEAKKELFKIDNEAIGNLDDPLAAPYHYYAHLMSIYWDLIEESPVFSDAERLKVTRSLSRQFDARKNDHDVYSLATPPKAVSGRHSQYAALSMLTVARYFSKYYPTPSWKHAYEASKNFFRALHKSAWIQGEAENMYWYSTSFAPSLKYVLLTGDWTPVENGNLVQLLRAHEMLMSGRPANWGMWYTSLNYLNKAAYLTGDGSWLHYRKQLGLGTDAFRLGQSFWPKSTKPHPPADLTDHWSVNPMPPGLWKERDISYPLDEGFLWASYRSQTGGEGDYILLDGFDSEARNPLHTFAIPELRIDGQTILQGKSQGRTAIIQGHFNQVYTKAGGLVKPNFPISSALRYHDVVGQTTTVVGEVPDQSFAGWKRTIAQRVGRYALIVDEMSFREKQQHMEVQTLWQGADASWNADRRAVTLTETDDSTGALKAAGEVRSADVLPVDLMGDEARMTWMGAVEPGDRRVQFALVTPGRSDQRACLRLADRAAVLKTPERALAVSGPYKGIDGELAILGENHLYGKALAGAEYGGRRLVEADQPVQLDWDFDTGRLVLKGQASTTVRLHTAETGGAEGRERSITLRTDSMIVENMYPGGSAREAIRTALSRDLETARQRRREALQREKAASQLEGKSLPTNWTTTVKGDTARLKVNSDATEPQQITYDYLNDREVLMEEGTVDGETRFFVSRGRTLTWLGPDGETQREIKLDSPIQTLKWWPGAEAQYGSPLLLVGDRAARVIAFTPQGERAWTFNSEMGKELIRSAKWYWMRPRNPGIIGMDTGRFVDGQPQAFIGSAGTLEILHPDGSLVGRWSTFWGSSTVFEVADRPGPGRDLLTAREPTGKMRAKVLNSKTLELSGPNFDAVPEGQTFVNPWLMMGRRHLFFEDMNGDGAKEVVGDMNGTWNRASIWKADGTPLYNVNFGPGKPIPYSNVRDFTVTNLDGDDTKEALVATDDGWLMALDHQLDKVWSKRLQRRPMTLATAARPEADGRLVVIATEDGTVRVFSPDGESLEHGSIEGTPQQVTIVEGGGDRPVAVVASEGGEVTSLPLEER